MLLEQADLQKVDLMGNLAWEISPHPYTRIQASLPTPHVARLVRLRFYFSEHPKVPPLHLYCLDTRTHDKI